MSIVESDWPPSWFLDASETGESAKGPWVGVAGGKNNSATPTHGPFVLSPVSLASRNQDGGQSDSTIDIYELTKK